MSESNVKFVVVGRPSDQAILGAEAPESIKKTIKQEVGMVDKCVSKLLGTGVTSST